MKNLLKKENVIDGIKIPDKEYEDAIDEIFADAEDAEEAEEAEIKRGIYYWHFRLTLSQDCTTEESRKNSGDHSMKNLRRKSLWAIDKFKELYIKRKHADDWTAVIELYDSKGEYTKPHLHFNFISEKSRDTMIKPIKAAYLEENGETLIGNEMYSLKPATFIDDNKWFRYGYKQLPCLDHPLNLTPKRNHKGIKNQERMYQRAHDQWIIGCEVNQKKASHNKTKEERFDRIVRFIEKESKPTSICEVALGITNFYIKEKSPINSNTIQGYTTTYCLKEGLLSVLKFSENIEKKILG